MFRQGNISNVTFIVLSDTQQKVLKIKIPNALPDEPLMGASPAAVLVIETGELLVRRTDDDLVARLKRYGTQGYAGAAGQGSLRGVKVFPCFSL